MKIGQPQIVQRDRDLEFSVSVESTEGSGKLWYRLDQAFSGLVSESSDAPLLALLIPAMASGEDIHIAGKVSQRLWHNLSRTYQVLLQHVIPSLRQIQIYPEEVITPVEQQPGVATGFSGGIDSYCVLADYYYDSEVPEAFKITHLLFNNVGSHGSDGEQLFLKRFARIEPVAERIGLPFVLVNSNLDSFYKHGTFQQTHTPRNASVALLLQGGIGRYMYASAYAFPDVFVGPTYDTAFSDPISLPLVSTESLDALSVGSEYSRIEKTLRVAEIPDSYDTLDVCVNEAHSGSPTNCSRCQKCLRTLLTLEIADALGRYSDSFDLDIYSRRRAEYIDTVLLSDDPLLREIVQFARDRDRPLPQRSRLSRSIRRATGSAKRLLNRALRRLRQGRWRGH